MAHTPAYRAKGYPVDSRRKELCGVLALFLYVTKLLEHYGMTTEEAIPLYCDNKETIYFAKDLYLGRTPRWEEEKNVDLIRKVEKLFHIEHVNSHQDKNIKEEYVSLPARMNKICDGKCNSLLNELRVTGEMVAPMPPLQSNKTTPLVDGGVVT